MKFIGEQKALERLSYLKTAFKNQIAEGYEHRAKSCLTCTTPGACCLDAHFVNVRISKLEAAAMVGVLKNLPLLKREEVYERIDATVEKYGLDAGDPIAKTYACPLFEKGIGCLVHNDGKPVPCITHACYENKADLPPDELQLNAEERIRDLNARTYGRVQPLVPLPLAVRRDR